MKILVSGCAGFIGYHTVKNLLNTTDTFIKVWRTFEVEKKPSKWIVWPYSESKGWLDKIEGKL